MNIKKEESIYSFKQIDEGEAFLRQGVLFLRIEPLTIKSSKGFITINSIDLRNGLGYSFKPFESVKKVEATIHYKEQKGEDK